MISKKCLFCVTKSYAPNKSKNCQIILCTKTGLHDRTYMSMVWIQRKWLRTLEGRGAHADL